MPGSTPTSGSESSSKGYSRFIGVAALLESLEQQSSCSYYSAIQNTAGSAYSEPELSVDPHERQPPPLRMGRVCVC